MKQLHTYAITLSANMKRNVLSGAQKRKKAAQKKEKIGKLPKLTSWLTNKDATPAHIPSNTEFTSAVSAASDSPSDIESTSTFISASSYPVSADIPSTSVIGTHSVLEDLKEEVPKSVTVKEFALSIETDPGLWTIHDVNTIDYWLRSGPSCCQNHDSNLSNSRRVYKGAGVEKMKTRYITNMVFKRELRNGEFVKREWLLYFPSKGCLYCFVCRLLSKKESQFSTLRFNT